VNASVGRNLPGSTLIVVVATLATTLVLRLILEHLMSVPTEWRWFWRDAFGNLAFVLVFWALIRRLVPTLAFSLTLIAGFQICNGIKLLVLGVPASPDDFINVGNLVFLTDGLARVGVIAVLVVPVLVLWWLVHWRTPVTWIVVASIALAVVGTLHYPVPLRTALDGRFGNSVWDQPGNYRTRGLALHLVQEAVRTAAKVGRAPDRAAVDAALADHARPVAADPSLSVAPAAAPTRNVHIIVLESFFDPLQLGAELVPDDPFSPEFRALWDRTGRSLALSPVFGGYTANAEFESLCGFPVTENAVFFEGWLRRSVPCLPAVLARAGYRTVASHPNVPGFWNRTHAYQLTGFEEYLSKADFDLNDSVKGLLLDSSYYEQLYEQLGPLDAAPLFNYALTYYGHLPYPVDARFGDQVAAGAEAPELLQGYLNHVWYKTRDLMARLEVLRVDDPDALIVVFGDHLPFLGPNYGVYAELLDLPERRDAFTGDQLEFLASTPLIVIDGRRGPVDAGKVPLYRLPSLIMRLLGQPDEGMFAWSAPLPGASDGRLMRPMYGMHIEVDPERRGEGAIVCQPERASPACRDGTDWLRRTRTLIGDVFSGRQFALERLADS